MTNYAVGDRIELTVTVEQVHGDECRVHFNGAPDASWLWISSFWLDTGRRIKPFDPATSPGMTDMMVPPESIDEWLKDNPPPPEGGMETSEEERESWKIRADDAGRLARDFARLLPTPKEK